jgi:hypothetical protein
MVSLYYCFYVGIYMAALSCSLRYLERHRMYRGVEQLVFTRLEWCSNSIEKCIEKISILLDKVSAQRAGIIWMLCRLSGISSCSHLASGSNIQ